MCKKKGFADKVDSADAYMEDFFNSEIKLDMNHNRNLM